MTALSKRTFTKGVLGCLAACAAGPALAVKAAAAPVSLFEPTTLRDLKLRNRMVMAPLTRCRAGVVERTANAMMAEHYAARASAGLIIAEATNVSPRGYGWIGTPGIYTESQAAGWKGVTDAVHNKGGLIFLQLWHMGRITHPDFLNGDTPIGPSAILAPGASRTPNGRKPYVVPREMTVKDIASTVQEYRQAAVYAKANGFDGIELHSANGYLLDQFLRDGTNQRTDAYGGSAEKRTRFLVEIIEAIAQVWPTERIGVRLSPNFTGNGMSDSTPAATFTQVAKILNRFGLAYLHIIDTMPGEGNADVPRIAPLMRAVFDGPVMLCGNYDAARGTAALAAGEADLIAYGRTFLANPDLVERYRRGIAVNTADPATFYTHDVVGYNDYPTAT